MKGGGCFNATAALLLCKKYFKEVQQCKAKSYNQNFNDN